MSQQQARAGEAPANAVTRDGPVGVAEPASLAEASRAEADNLRFDVLNLLNHWSQSMVEVAKRHPAAKPWRDAFERNGCGACHRASLVGSSASSPATSASS